MQSIKKGAKVTYFDGSISYEPIHGDYVISLVEGKVWLDATPRLGPGRRVCSSRMGSWANKAPLKSHGNVRICAYRRPPYYCSLVATRNIKKYEEILVDSYGDTYNKMSKSDLRCDETMGSAKK